MRTRSSRVTAVALTAAVALTSLDLAPASAASAAGGTQATKTSTIDLSARRRHLRRGDAFMLGAVASVFGAIAATAAAHRYRERYITTASLMTMGLTIRWLCRALRLWRPGAYGPAFRFHGGRHGRHGGRHGHQGRHHSG